MSKASNNALFRTTLLTLSTAFRTSKEHNLAQSYFLLGHREGFAVSRLSAILEVTTRCARFLQANRAALQSFWIVAYGIDSLYVTCWFAQTASVNMYVNVSRRQTIFLWAGRFFYMTTQTRNFNIFRFLGAGLVIFMSEQTPHTHARMSAVRSLGIPTIETVGLTVEAARVATYPLVGGEAGRASWRLQLFYFRLLLSMLK